MKTTSHLLIKGVLEKLPLLDGINYETIRELSTQSSVLRMRRGQMVLRRGERVPGLYAIAFGNVKTRLAQNGNGEVVLGLLGPGATFGKSAVLLDRPSRVDVVTLDETMLVAVRAACVVDLIERNLRFSRNLAKALAERNHVLLGELEVSRLRSAQRLAAFLDSIAAPAAQPGAGVARLGMSKTLLASRLGIKKETLSRLLREFAAEGLIRVAGRDIAIHDLPRLKALAAAASLQ